MTRWMIPLSLLLVLWVWLAPAWANDTTYYVDNQLPGSDSNNGTSTATPFLTVTKCLATASAPGDTCLIKNGTYAHGANVLYFHYSGTAGHPITLKNYPGHTPVLTWTSGVPNTITNHSAFLLVSAPNSLNSVSYGVIEGLEITGAVNGIKIDNADHFIIRNNNLHGNGHGLLFNGAYLVTVDRNLVHSNGQFNRCAGTPTTCNQDHGMYLTCGNCTITNNIIYDNLAYGIQATGHPFNAATQTTANHAGFHDNLIANNTIAYERFMAGIAMWDDSKQTNNTYRNNICYENAQSAQESSSQCFDYVSCSGCTGTISHTLWYGTGANTGFFRVTQPAGFTVTTTTNQHPNFVTAPSTVPGVPDFHVNTGSPAIGTGYDLTGLVTTDYYSTLRSAPYDRGAVKYTAAGGGGGGGTNNFTQVATDTFNRAAEDPLTASNWVLNSAAGHGFLIPAASPTVAQPKSFSGVDAMMTWVGAGTFTDDQYCQVVLGPVATTGGDNTIGYGCTVRATISAGVKTAYALIASHSGWELRRDVAGSKTSLAKSTSTLFSQGDSITAAVYGSSPPTFVLQKNSTDIDLTGATRCGSCGASGAITDGNASSISTGVPGLFYSTTETGGTDHGIDTFFGGNYVNGADVTAPTVPGDLTVTPNLPNQLLVSWTASTDNVAVTSYTLQACSPHACTSFATIASPAGTSYTYTGLTNNTVYALKVRANDAAGNSSAYATAVEGTTLPSTQVPVISNPIPTGTTVLDADPITISINTDIPAVCKYNTRTEGTAAYASLTHTMTANALVNSASVHPDISTSNSGVNHFYIACDNAVSLGHASATTDMTFTMITPSDDVKPSTIVDLSATALDAVRIQLSWSAATDDTAVTGYNLYCSTGIGTPVVTYNTDPTTATPILVAGAVDTSAVLTLTLGTVYNCVITGFDAAGNIALDSNIATSQTFSSLTPPTDVHQVGPASNSIVSLVWSPSTDVLATGYNVYQSSTSGQLGTQVGMITAAWAAAHHTTMTTFTTELSVGGTYYFTIKATDVNGVEGSGSTPLTVTVTGAVARTAR